MRSILATLLLTLSSLAGDFTERLDKALEADKIPGADRLASEKYNAKEFDAAAELYLEHVAKRPDDSAAWYNLACCLSLGGHKTDAVRALEKAIETGFRDLDHMDGDSDLDPLRKKKAFKALMKGLKEEQGPETETVWVGGEALLPCYVATPEDYDETRACGLILLLHGRGDNAKRFLEAMDEFRGKDFILASLESPYVMGNFGGRQAHCWSPWESGKGNIERGYGHSADSVGRALRALRKAHKLDDARVYLLGFSEGAFLSAHCGFSCPEEFAGYVCIGGGVDMNLAKEAEYGDLKGKRILVAHGTSDAVVPYESGRRLSEALKENGVEHEMFPYAGGHTLTPDVRRGVAQWLRGAKVDEELKADPPPKK
jgi:phospholipase/carboxylesterase